MVPADSAYDVNAKPPPSASDHSLPSRTARPAVKRHAEPSSVTLREPPKYTSKRSKFDVESSTAPAPAHWMNTLSEVGKRSGGPSGSQAARTVSDSFDPAHATTVSNQILDSGD